MAYFRYRRLSDDKIKRYITRGLDVIEGAYNFILPIRNKLGDRIPIPTIQTYGWVMEYVPTQTDERIAYEKYVYFYEVEPSLQGKIELVKGLYDFLGVNYDCTTDDLEEAVITKYPNPQEALAFSKDLSDKSEAAAEIMVKAYHKYLKDVEKDDDANPVGAWSFYQEFPQVVKWIPGTYTEEDIPEKLLPIIVTNEESFADFNATI